MLNRFFFVLLALVLPSTKGFASDGDFVERIDRAVEQRMLSQRIAKSYSQLGLNLQPIVAKQELDEAILRFDDNLGFLEA
ncbi:MAG TPA: type IV pili methyl-accepting chemotaxis transducer N-terminal domain-containing protein, partial [Rhodocyclaceae bacterium]|nr:type IV pili methyl-accepting chemotaxis transducer N-terminal domain-containing protein [Rhodocyclaceae bacterium]